MAPNSEQIRVSVRKLIGFLRSLEDDDHERGLKAAQNIERTLAKFESGSEGAIQLLRYDIGGKGILDWIWSDEHQKQLEKFSDEIYRLTEA